VRKSIKPCGAVVKYNPCTRYARGSPCPYFDKVKKCNKLRLACEMPEYDRWYKDVLEEKRKCFYPNLIRLLENPGVPMFLFHVHHHAIMGEAKVLRSSVEDGKHFYWFDKFLSYPRPVQLELLETDSRLPKMASRGIWSCVYISKETIEEIRSLSELSEKERNKLENDLEVVIEQLKENLFCRPNRIDWKFYLENECEKLKKNYKLSEEILAETRKYLSELFQKELAIRGPRKEKFYTSLYIAFRMSETPKLFGDISRMSGINPKKLRKLYRLIVRELNLIVPYVGPEQLIKSRSRKLNISKKTIERAISLVREARKRRLTFGKAPSSIAAAATFLACQKEGEKKKKEEIAETFGVTTVTIRNYSKKLDVL